VRHRRHPVGPQAVQFFERRDVLHDDHPAAFAHGGDAGVKCPVFRPGDLGDERFHALAGLVISVVQLRQPQRGHGLAEHLLGPDVQIALGGPVGQPHQPPLVEHDDHVGGVADDRRQPVALALGGLVKPRVLDGGGDLRGKG